MSFSIHKKPIVGVKKVNIIVGMSSYPAMYAAWIKVFGIGKNNVILQRDFDFLVNAYLYLRIYPECIIITPRLKDILSGFGVIPGFKGFISLIPNGRFLQASHCLFSFQMNHDAVVSLCDSIENGSLKASLVNFSTAFNYAGIKWDDFSVISSTKRQTDYTVFKISTENKVLCESDLSRFSKQEANIGLLKAGYIGDTVYQDVTQGDVTFISSSEDDTSRAVQAAILLNLTLVIKHDLSIKDAAIIFQCRNEAVIPVLSYPMIVLGCAVTLFEKGAPTDSNLNKSSKEIKREPIRKSKFKDKNISTATADSSTESKDSSGRRNFSTKASRTFQNEINSLRDEIMGYIKKNLPKIDSSD